MQQVSTLVLINDLVLAVDVTLGVPFQVHETQRPIDLLDEFVLLGVVLLGVHERLEVLHTHLLLLVQESVMLLDAVLHDAPNNTIINRRTSASSNCTNCP